MSEIFADCSKEKSQNKKVLLREHKRHTTHHIASARYAALSNGWGDTPSSPGGVGYPGYPPPSRPGQGVPLPHLTIQTWSGWGTLGTPTIQTWDGYPPTQTWDGVPSHLDLGWGTPLPRPEIGYPPPRPGMGYPLPRSEMGYPPT